VTTYKRNLGALGALLPTLALAGCGQTTFNQEIAGRWKSATCESAGPAGFLQREFNITPSDWTIQVNVYGDAACSAKLLTLDAKGKLDVIGPSRSVAGAYDVNYVFTSRTLTPRADPIVQQVNRATCGGKADWAVGQSGDVTVSGCAPLGIEPRPPCDKEMDLNRRDGDRLFFGDRSASLCSARPAKLGELPVVRQ
jgi:hypothetical protein